MDLVVELIMRSLKQVATTFLHTWYFLAISVVIATLSKLYMDSAKLSAFLCRNRRTGVIAATAAAVGTPLCSGGTMAVVLGMMAGTMPWAPIVAFMVASPLTSPDELVYSAGLFGWPFALAFFFASIILGLAGGFAAGFLENRGLLANQARFAAPAARVSCGCAEQDCEPQAAGCADSRHTAIAEEQVPAKRKILPRILFPELGRTSKQLLVIFLGFTFIGYFLNGIIPSNLVEAAFGGVHVYSVPLAATLGLPLYINSEASLPLIRTLLDTGMSQGAALAFLISGAGTSIGAIAGAMTIARWRVITLVVVVLWIGAIVTGYAYDLLAASGIL